MASLLKFIVLLALVATVVVADVEEEEELGQVVPQSATSNDLILGRREDGDKLILTETVQAGAHIIPGKKVIIRKIFDVGNREITMIKALDRATKNGASVEKVSGGLGEDSVTLRFKSQRFHGINFSVQVYAKDAE